MTTTGHQTEPSRQVSYRLSLEKPQTHCVSVTMTLKGLRGSIRDGKVALVMPVWTPGSYLVREFSRNILSIEASDGAGRKLHVSKESKTRWLVTAGEDDELVVNYLVYAFAFGTNTSYIDADHAIINGASVFLYAEGFEAAPISLDVVPYSGWKVIATGMESAGGSPWSLIAPDYDVLVDSPIEVGNQHVHAFEVNGVPHEASIYAAVPIDEGKFVSDLKRIVEATVPIYGDIPYKRYVFLVDFVSDGYAGLEHLNSTHCVAGYFFLDPPQEYRNLLTLFSHEFFHVWNVKRMRPKALGPFDYTSENYTKTLWVAEGITSYYEEVILRRAGILPVSELFEHLSLPLSYVKGLPSSRWQTPEESSFDSWIRYYRQDENSPNVSPSYYRQGTVLGLLLDLRIRDATDNATNLDDVMRKVYRETYLATGLGYTDDEFERACDQLSLGATSEIFSRYVHSKEEIDYDKYLGLAGMTVVPKVQPSLEEGFLGIRVKATPNLSVLTRLTDSPAEAADLSAGDEIIATDGLRTDAQRLPFYVANRKPGSEVELTIARAGSLKTIRVKLGAKPTLEYKLQKKPQASDKEKAVFRGWALEDWDTPVTLPDYRSSPARARVFDYF